MTETERDLLVLLGQFVRAMAPPKGPGCHVQREITAKLQVLKEEARERRLRSREEE